MRDQKMIATISEVTAADDPWGAFTTWLDKRRAENHRRGGDDMGFIIRAMMQEIACQTPASSGGQK
ncbi:hypothetical protein [Acidimangrovimonas sediminis]|uniref:hypothetical protein n=1 Tax=Acidimangrovimonas sediminis TaxID=2056283 RepID=UPI0011AF8BBA|nr:hypothetical protein [Acidimangrovimonas sediminis]